jgi:hypothetical protein
MKNDSARKVRGRFRHKFQDGTLSHTKAIDITGNG